MATVKTRERGTALVRAIPTPYGVEDARALQCLQAIIENLQALTAIVVEVADTEVVEIPDIVITNEGGGVGLFSDVDGHNVKLRTLAGGGDIQISEEGGVITISVEVESYTEGDGIDISGQNVISLDLTNIDFTTAYDQANDSLFVWDASEEAGSGGLRQATIDTFVKDVELGSEYHQTDDSIYIWDGDAEGFRQVLLDTIMDAVDTTATFDPANDTIYVLDDSESGLRQTTLEDLLKGLSGYDAGETQVAGHVSGTWQLITVAECP